MPTKSLKHKTQCPIRWLDFHEICWWKKLCLCGEQWGHQLRLVMSMWRLHSFMLLVGGFELPAGNRLELATFQSKRTLQRRKKYVVSVWNKPWNSTPSNHKNCYLGYETNLETSFSEPITILRHFDHVLIGGFRESNTCTSSALEVTHWPSQCRASGCRIRKQLCSRWAQNRRRAPQMLPHAPSVPCSMSWRKPT